MDICLLWVLCVVR